MRAVVLYFPGHNTGLKNDGHPRDDIRGEDTAAPRILATADCC